MEACIILPSLFFLFPYFKKTAAFQAALTLVISLPIFWIGRLHNELLFKGCLITNLILAWLLCIRLIRSNRSRKIMLISYLIICSSVCIHDLILLTLKYNYSFSDEIKNHNIRNDWEGHLNHPSHPYYYQFWSKKLPSWLFYQKSGESAEGALRIVRTGKSSKNDPQ